MKTKTVFQSQSILSEVMMPAYANHYGSVHAGTILKLVDEVAFVAATKHCRKNVVTASLDSIEFRHPVNVGDVLTLKASVFNVGKTSMDVEVDIKAEKIKEGKALKVGSAYLTMVAIGKGGRPVRVPGLALMTKDEADKNKQIKEKRQRRIEHFLNS